MKKVAFFILVFLLANCVYSNDINSPFTNLKLVVSSDKLSELDCDPPGVLLIKKDAIYCGTPLTSTIVKFDKDFNPLKKYCKVGQGPGEFDGFMSMVLDGDNILVFAGHKIVVLDKDLNFLKEIRNKNLNHAMYPFFSKNRYYFAEFSNPWNIVVLDKNFNILKRIKVEYKLPFKTNSPVDNVFLYAFVPLRGKYIVSSGFFINNENCFFKVFNVETLKFEKTYKWENKNYRTTENQYRRRKNIYLLDGVFETADYYILRTCFVKDLRNPHSKKTREIIIFDKKDDKLVYRKNNFEYYGLGCVLNYTGDNRFYLYNDDGIYSCKVKVK